MNECEIMPLSTSRCRGGGPCRRSAPAPVGRHPRRGHRPPFPASPGYMLVIRGTCYLLHLHRDIDVFELAANLAQLRHVRDVVHDHERVPFVVFSVAHSSRSAQICSVGGRGCSSLSSSARPHHPRRKWVMALYTATPNVVGEGVGRPVYSYSRSLARCTIARTCRPASTQSVNSFPWATRVHVDHGQVPQEPDGRLLAR